MAKRLWMIFGPIAVAALVLAALLFSPFKIDGISSKTERQAATSLSPNVFKGQEIKQRSLSSGYYVPFFGSSELSRFDLAHPSVLAEKYNRNYRPFLLGAPGTQSLTQYFQMQSISSDMKNRKAVFVISPQWFVKQGTNPKYFQFYFSAMQATSFIQQNQKSTPASRYAAKRLVALEGPTLNARLKDALVKMGQGKPISSADKIYFEYYSRLLKHEDQLFSGIRLGNNVGTIDKQEAKLPNNDNSKEIQEAVNKEAKAETTNNPFKIKNSFYDKRLKSDIGRKLKPGFEKNFDYTESPEFADFQLVLDQFNRQNTNVMFIIPPINERWAKYAGLSMSMIREFDKKINYQLKEQGFTNVVDLSKDGSKPYFMEDTIHIGWNGWLAVDKKVKPFLEKKQKEPKYHIENRFLSKDWQYLNPNDISSFKK